MAPFRLLGLLSVAALVSAQQPHRAVAELLAAQSTPTVNGWMRGHPVDKLAKYSAETARSRIYWSGDFCALATTEFTDSDLPFKRTAVFVLPATANLRLRSGDGPYSDMFRQCVLNEIIVEGEHPPGARTKLEAEIEAGLAHALGPAQPMRPRHGPPILPAKPGTVREWQVRDRRWFLTENVNTQGLLGLALAPGAEEAQTTDLIGKQIKQAEILAPETMLPAREVRQMQTYLEQVGRLQQRAMGATMPDSEVITPFLIRWVGHSRALPPAPRAAGLYAADILLEFMPLYMASDRGPEGSDEGLQQKSLLTRKKFGAVGAHFTWDHLGGGYSYDREWIQEAFRIAPDSAAGQQAFLFLLSQSFHPSCCCGGQDEGFEAVIERAPQYLRDHPSWTIQPDILLAIGDAHRDLIAVASGANDDVFGNAAKFRSRVKQSYAEALRNYRAAIAASPVGDNAKAALRSAWALQAGLTPLTTRFVCIYD